MSLHSNYYEALVQLSIGPTKCVKFKVPLEFLFNKLSYSPKTEKEKEPAYKSLKGFPELGLNVWLALPVGTDIGLLSWVGPRMIGPW